VTNLSDYISVRRRYSRSINLERDLMVADSICGYVLTPKTVETITRFIKAYLSPHSVRSFTLTGVYGTGKSAFAHFLSALCAPAWERIGQKATDILKKHDRRLYAKLVKILPKNGLIRAIVTARREPVANTIVRALWNGTSHYWDNVKGPKPKALTKIKRLHAAAEKGERINDGLVISIIKEIARSTKYGLLIVVDELGKNLEFAAQNQITGDFYLLQQIAELPSGRHDPKIFLFGLLHQSFSDYSHGLQAEQQKEWAKIQGRFEDIPFVESSEEVLHLLSQAIDQTAARSIRTSIKKWAGKWNAELKKSNMFKSIDTSIVASIYPLNPISAVVLPILCTRYAQNDRTLFTFLSSQEPHSFSSFVRLFSINNSYLPTLKLHNVYDYFVESAGILMTSKPQFQRWIEIQGRISDARHFEPDVLLVLKTIGMLNLVSASGSLRASRKMVALALCDDPTSKNELQHWLKIIDKLLEKGYLTWRKQLDELRIWEGSDFNVEHEVSSAVQIIRESLAVLLNRHEPLRALIVQRHSYQTGTLRYFESQYCDDYDALKNAACSNLDSDGLICYWVGKGAPPSDIPAQTVNGKPLIIISSKGLSNLRSACFEFVALNLICSSSPQLSNDGVARREVMHRLMAARNVLMQSLELTFNFSLNKIICWVAGKKTVFKSKRAFNDALSSLCDTAYSKGLHLWNELINRRELTSQGARARRELIEAMLANVGNERLSLLGNGPESCIFESLFEKTGIYKKEAGEWMFSDPIKRKGVTSAWIAIEVFCLSASGGPANIDALYKKLNAPPYGIKNGVIPLLFLAVLLKHNEDLSLYLDGSFIPQLGSEHFELLVKKPERFSVRYFKISKIHGQVFSEFKKIFNKQSVQTGKRLRNAKLLSVVKPLIVFVKALPRFSLSTNQVSAEAKMLRRALLEARDPHQLLFIDLPKIFGIDLSNGNLDSIKMFVGKMVKILKELQLAYDQLIGQCLELIYQAFSVQSDKKKLREDLRIRASYLIGQTLEPNLRRFVIAATDEKSNDYTWREAIIMVVADKPVESWNDGGFGLFQVKLAEIARRFMNLEIFQKEESIFPKEKFDARKITFTYPDGSEIRKMVWVNRKTKKQIERIVQDILSKQVSGNDDRFKEALVASLIEKLWHRA